MRRCVLLVCVLLGALLTPTAQAAPPGNKDVLVHLFSWNWNSVARECRDFLGPRGFGGVQVSPPQEHVVVNGFPWWQDYQPVSYGLNTRRGNESEFKAMVDSCHTAGVKVYADAVINHMSGQDGGGTGSGGSRFGHYDYPGIYQHQDFNHCGRNGNDDIQNYRDAYEVQFCELVNLADLKSGSDYVRDRIAGYLNKLLALGVDGFRIDAAKHMPPGDIAAIKARLSRPAYLYQEVIPGAGEPIRPEQYAGNGDLLEFHYGEDLARIFNQEKLSYLRTFGSTLPSGSAVVFTDNHDTQRGSGVLTYRDNARYALANAFMLAWPYGSPKLMSSYEFGNKDEGPPAEASGRTRDSACFTDRWRCEHRWQVIANLVEFRNAVRGTGVNNWWDNGNDVIGFGRGDKGYLVLNDESPVIGRSFQTGLPAGRYCDVVHGNFSGGSCSGPVYTVDGGGWFRADVAAQDGIALHVNAKLP
ncbi:MULTISPECIES: alpha-amylase family protein [unclassified Crossiella]|uniref:alpha-amylase n=1 Tax=unclassified Crossiella TaxID=2620835 RepID=UPI001FFEE72C|nr:MULTISPECIES: alpha-amylase family protein [unclassified Crossiella]MCK2245179.1 alpha-amylase family protein [Crossiella sp. S99.2]MCK2258832.1 alpha-amylase family protein [Crossiella sp. S99.1]